MTGEATAQLPAGVVPQIAPLARALSALARVPEATPVPDEVEAHVDPAGSSHHLAIDRRALDELAAERGVDDPGRSARLAAMPSAPETASDAMRAEEIERTRLFLRMGWLLSLAAIGTVFVVGAQVEIAGLFVFGLATGMIVSYGYHRAFADPRNYTEHALMTLGAICAINGHIAVLMYGAYTASTIMIAIGIHFVARTEAERVARWILAGAFLLYGAIALAIITGAIHDPGVFASTHPVGRVPLVVGACFVLAAFWLAYYTARQIRLASITAIEDLQRATRLAAHREAVMDELRADLERALRAGPGRYTDQSAGRFRLRAVLGRGAMGEVYDAVDSAGPAAVKILRRELANDPAQRARFAREIEATRASASTHVVRVLAGDAQAAVPYLAMERLAGHTLAELLRRAPRLSPDALRALVRQVGQALDGLAAVGLVHRDLKPQNLFCCIDGRGAAGSEWQRGVVDGTWKVIDFGVAVRAGELADGVVGTPHYMAPEQAQGRRVDARTDLYALGAIAYRCATGRPPFDAADPAALLYAIVHRTAIRPGALAELPADVDRWCALALARAPADRFASGAAMADALDAALDGRLDRALRMRADAAIRAWPWGAS